MVLNLPGIVSRTFRQSWRKKWLWALGLFGGGSFGYAGLTNNVPGGPALTVSRLGTLLDRARDYVPLILLVIGIVLFVALISFVVSSLAVPASVWAAAALDAQENPRFAEAFAAGRRHFWAQIRLGLIRLAIGLAMVAVVAVLVVAGLGIYLSSGDSTLSFLIPTAIGLGVVFLLGTIFVSLVFVWAQRTIVLLDQGAVASIRSSWELTRHHLLDTVAFAVVMGTVVSLVGAVAFFVVGVAIRPGVLMFTSGLGNANLLLMIPGVVWVVFIGGVTLLIGGGYAGSLVQISYALACRDLCRRDGLLAA